MWTIFAAIFGKFQQSRAGHARFGRIKRPVLMNRNLTRWMFRLSLLLLIGFLTWAAIYGGTRGFVRKWRTLLSDELGHFGVFVSIERLTIDPARGLLAQNVRIFTAQEKTELLAVLDEAGVDINFFAMAMRDDFLNAVNLQDTTVWVFTPGAPDLLPSQMKSVDAEWIFSDGGIELSGGQGYLGMVEITASGRLNIAPPSSEAPDANAENAIQSPLSNSLTRQASEGWIRIPHTLAALQSEAPGLPRLSMEFDFDLAAPGAMRVDLRFSANRFSLGDLSGDHLGLVLQARDGQVQLRELLWERAGGELRLRADWDLAAGRLRYALDNTMDPAMFKHWLPSPWDEYQLRMIEPWALKMSGTLSRNGGPNSHGIAQLALGRFVLNQTEYEQLSADLSWRGERRMIKDLKLQQGTGELHLNALWGGPKEGELQLRSSLNAEAITPWLPFKWRNWMETIQFGGIPDLQLTATMQNRIWTGEGRTTAPEIRIQGMQILNHDIPIQIVNNELHAGPAQFQTGSLGMQGHFYLQLQDGKTRFELREKPAVPGE